SLLELAGIHAGDERVQVRRIAVGSRLHEGLELGVVPHHALVVVDRAPQEPQIPPQLELLLLLDGRLDDRDRHHGEDRDDRGRADQLDQRHAEDAAPARARSSLPRGGARRRGRRDRGRRVDRGQGSHLPCTLMIAVVNDEGRVLAFGSRTIDPVKESVQDPGALARNWKLASRPAPLAPVGVPTREAPTTISPCPCTSVATNTVWPPPCERKSPSTP